MPPLSRRQFWKANPNQMALPGLEEHAHPGAKMLSQGDYHFEDQSWMVPQGVRRLAVVKPGGDPVSHLEWDVGLHSGRGAGEISGVETELGHTGKGLATALYGVGRTMGRVKPRHSKDRTPEGNVWAHKTAEKYGGRVPKLLTHDENGFRIEPDHYHD